MTHFVFNLFTPTGGSRARMSVFTNDLTIFWIFPALGVGIPNFWTESLLTFNVNSHFLNLDPDWDIFLSVTAPKPCKMRGLEIPVNKALPTKISYCNFLYT